MAKETDDPIEGLLREAQEAARSAQAAVEESRKQIQGLIAAQAPAPTTQPAVSGNYEPAPGYEDLVARVTDGVGERLLALLEERGALPEPPTAPAPQPADQPDAAKEDPAPPRSSWRERLLGT